MTDRRDDHDAAPLLASPISRRDALVRGGIAGAGALAGGALAPIRALAAAGEEPQVPRKVLGKTGKSIPILLLGGGMGFDPRFDPRLVEALRHGVEYIDAADCYKGGQCETSVGNFHTKMKNRADLWITSKSDEYEAEAFERRLGECLKRLQTDYVDMYYLHGIDDLDLFTPELERTVKRLKDEGTVRHFGFSCHDGKVAELLHKAAKTPWVESVMFRYSFHRYGDAKLNDAIDAAHEAGVGLIAMKTQGAEAKRDLWKEFRDGGRWTKHQAVLKLVWADERITAAVSHMDTLEKLQQNIAAAVDRSELTANERAAIDRYAAATRAFACDGCDHLCSPAVKGEVRIGDTMRYLMYHDVYGRESYARELFGRLPTEARDLRAVDFGPARDACPFGVDVPAFMDRAATVLA